jgi:effector-binding domain-containing protein
VVSFNLSNFIISHSAESHQLKKQLPYFVAFFVVPVLVVMWWWGLFSGASVGVEQSTDYTYAYLEAQGPYSKLSSKQAEVQFELKKQGLESGAAITLVMSDPRNTSYKELMARTGFIIDQRDQVLPPLQVAKLPKQKVLVASVKAHPLFAYGKTYSAILDYCKAHDMKLKLPTVEIVEHSVLRVEMPLESDSAL